MAAAVQAYVPGYRLKAQQVQFEVILEDRPVNLPGVGCFSGLKTAVYLEVEGAAHLPAYAATRYYDLGGAGDGGANRGNAQRGGDSMNGKNFISRT